MSAPKKDWNTEVEDANRAASGLPPLDESTRRRNSRRRVLLRQALSLAMGYDWEDQSTNLDVGDLVRRALDMAGDARFEARLGELETRLDRMMELVRGARDGAALRTAEAK